jgi:carotenoid cleavage dioxygenase-like enzyme
MENNPYLDGNYAPVHDELEIENLKIIGEIPKDLTGIYMRNGPNPEFPPISYTYPFDGDGMIHAIYLANGKAHYRNRYVETRELKKERRAGKALYSGVLNPRPLEPEWADPEDEPIAIKNGVTIHIIRHAGQYLALSEASPAYEMTAELKTIGEWNPSNNLSFPVCAHTRLDPVNGDLWFINYAMQPPYLTLYCVDNKGAVIKKINIEKNYTSMVHDFVLTKNHIIIFDCPIIIDLQQVMAGGSIIDWKPELGVRIAIVSRNDGKIQWLETDPFFVFHFANAYEDRNEIRIDYVRHEKFDFITNNDERTMSPMLYRSVINLHSGAIKHIPLDDRIIEFPRIREDIDTLAHQFIYAPTKTVEMQSERGFNALVKYDVKNGYSELYKFGSATQIGEAVFAPRKNSRSEDDGYLMLFVFDATIEQSEFVILDAKHSGTTPLARIKVPRRIPHGFHGSWMPGDWSVQPGS